MRKHDERASTSRLARLRRPGRTVGAIGWKGLAAGSIALTLFGAGCDQAPDSEQDDGIIEQATSQVRVVNATEQARMEQYLQNRYDRADITHSFTTASGDDVDCVVTGRQPGLRGRRLASVPTAPANAPPSMAASGSAGLLKGDPDALGRPRACPSGSVPIRVTKLKEMLHFKTIEDFRRKVPLHISRSPAASLPAPPAANTGPTAEHQYAVLQSSVVNHGVNALINVWKTSVELSSEFALTQMWAYRGTGADLETVEAGFQVFRDLYGDGQSRLFIYFTPDNYGAGGCYNLDCTAFVQTDGSVVIGGALPAYSVKDGAQVEVDLLLWKDLDNGSWWLRYNYIWVGYWPRDLFDENGIATMASGADFGGEILDLVSTRHTKTDMGSGAFPSAGYRKAAYQRNVTYFEQGTGVGLPVGGAGVNDDSKCYSITTGNNLLPGWGRSFFFGGTGYHTSNCR